MEDSEPQIRGYPCHHEQKRVLHQHGPKKEQNQNSEASINHRQFSLMLQQGSLDELICPEPLLAA
jgi:hypothetical protein